MSTGEDDRRFRQLEEIAIRLDERAKIWDSMMPRIVVLETGMNSLFAAVGQLRFKAGLVWTIVASIAGIGGGVVASLITKHLGP